MSSLNDRAVYRFICDTDHFSNLETDRDTEDLVDCFWEEDRVIERWRPSHVVLDSSGKRVPGAFPMLDSSAPVIRNDAFLLLEDLLSPTIEKLPLSCGGKQFWVLNVPISRGVMDMDSSQLEYDRFGNPTANHGIYSRALIEGEMFTVRETWGDILVTGLFLNRVQEKGLDGLAVGDCRGVLV